MHDWGRQTQGAAVSLPALEQRLLEEAVQRANGNLSSAARTLGITRARPWPTGCSGAGRMPRTTEPAGPAQHSAAGSASITLPSPPA